MQPGTTTLCRSVRGVLCRNAHSLAPRRAATAAAVSASAISRRPRWAALQRRGMAVETAEPTPVPPPPPAPRNYVYPAVLALTAATVAYVIMTPDDDNIDAKIMEAVRAKMPVAEEGEEGGYGGARAK